MTFTEWNQYRESFLEELQFYANLDTHLKIHDPEQALCSIIKTRAQDFLNSHKLPLKPSNVTNAVKSSPG